MASKNKVTVAIKGNERGIKIGGTRTGTDADTENDVVIANNNLIGSSFPEKTDSVALRQWWHKILHTYGKYSCCAFILALPSDKHIINYLTEFGRELDLISGKNCLVIALSDTQVIRYGFEETKWRIAIHEHISNGHSLEVAKLFNIKFTELPCLVIFQDIRSSDHLVISLHKWEIDEISQKMRSIFSIVQFAINQKTNPLVELRRQITKKELQKAGISFVGKLRSFAGKTFETAMEAVIQSTIKNA